MKLFNSIKIIENGNEIQIFVNRDYKGCFELHEYSANHQMRMLKMSKADYISNLWTNKILPFLDDAGTRDIEAFRKWFISISWIALRINNLVI